MRRLSQCHRPRAESTSSSSLPPIRDISCVATLAFSRDFLLTLSFQFWLQVRSPDSFLVLRELITDPRMRPRPETQSSFETLTVYYKTRITMSNGTFQLLRAHPLAFQQRTYLVHRSTTVVEYFSGFLIEFLDHRLNNSKEMLLPAFKLLQSKLHNSGA